ncbi:hypothetical protein BKA70DRAFT_838896 [Coprinopsis sp. MPI-PUGE-AT-0042]|nr:hypothetical protein BKA70DRAFT_838896 [Coprinopsis sp. MPI-PUGE-AT-0042]
MYPSSCTCPVILGYCWTNATHALCPHSSRTVTVEQPIRKRNCPCYEERVICFDHLQLDSSVFTLRTSSTPDKPLVLSFGQSHSIFKVRLLGHHGSLLGSSAGGKGDAARRSLSVEACRSAAEEALLRQPQPSPPLIHSQPYLTSPATCRLESLTTARPTRRGSKHSARLAMTKVKPRILHLLS